MLASFCYIEFHVDHMLNVLKNQVLSYYLMKLPAASGWGI